MLGRLTAGVGRRPSATSPTPSQVVCTSRLSVAHAIYKEPKTCLGLT